MLTIKTQQVAGANCNAVESETTQKNGVWLKNHKSRQKIYLCFACLLLLFTVSCERDVEATFVVGQEHEGGIVAWVTTDGRHGLIAAPKDISVVGVSWNKGSYEDFEQLDDYIGCGKYNTSKIVSKFGNGNYAAKLCQDLVLNGYDDWFLPSFYELNELYKNQDKIGGFNKNSYYWSSSTYRYYDNSKKNYKIFPYCIYFNNGERYYDDENYNNPLAELNFLKKNIDKKLCIN